MLSNLNINLYISILSIYLQGWPTSAPDHRWRAVTPEGDQTGADICGDRGRVHPMPRRQVGPQHLGAAAGGGP